MKFIQTVIKGFRPIFDLLLNKQRVTRTKPVSTIPKLRIPSNEHYKSSIPNYSEVNNALLREYVTKFVSIDDFRDSYDDEEIDKLKCKQHYIKYIDSPLDIRFLNGSSALGTVVVELCIECVVKDTFNTKILFKNHSISIEDRNLKSLIRDKKLDKLI